MPNMVRVSYTILQQTWEGEENLGVVVIVFAVTSGVIVDLHRILMISSIAPLSMAIFLYI
jgi:hypothetical protein